MRKSGFLHKLKREGKLKSVESSVDICDSYLRKSDDCLRAGKVLIDSDLYENSISESYYAMYNVLTALLFRTGIKCENHTGSIMLLDTIFGRKDLSGIIAKSKKERIDKQYYVTSNDGPGLTRENAKDMSRAAEDFLIEVKLMIEGMTGEKTDSYRKVFSGILGNT